MFSAPPGPLDDLPCDDFDPMLAAAFHRIPDPSQLPFDNASVPHETVIDSPSPCHNGPTPDPFEHPARSQRYVFPPCPPPYAPPALPSPAVLLQPLYPPALTVHVLFDSEEVFPFCDVIFNMLDT